MRSVETTQTFLLSSVKPLEEIAGYRNRCLALTREFVRRSATRREHSPVTGEPLVPYGKVEDLSYGQCPATGSLFLMEMTCAEEWAKLLSQVARLRHSPEGFHRHLAQSRMDHVYAPKLEWVEETIRLQQIAHPRVLEVATALSDFTQLLKESGSFSEVLSEDETALAVSSPAKASSRAHAAVLLESLDRSVNPAGLLAGLRDRVEEGGLLFVTALVASGFDFQLLGLRNAYLVPPDRANCFTLKGLLELLVRHGFTPLEVSTPGVLDVEVVRAHCQKDPTVPLSKFERQILEGDDHTRWVFQSFLQQQGMSSFARIAARREQ